VGLQIPAVLLEARGLSAPSLNPFAARKPMEQKPIDLRKKIVRYRRSRAVMMPDMIKMIDRIIKETEEQIETAESR
jgi:hypothetical protein